MKISSHQAPQRWDIFCRVIDNYGDIGVCWRLARQLHSEVGLSVRLWLDDLEVLRRLWPETADRPLQIVNGVAVAYWPKDFPVVEPAEVVIEAFACELPSAYVAAMAQRHPRPYWLNLEYLSAEDWVEGCHGMRSIHPQNGLIKTFFFPGFSPKTGGVICEATLRDTRDAFQENPSARSEFLASLHVSPHRDALLISLFSYENSALPDLLDAWRSGSQPIHCLVPEGRILSVISEYLGYAPDLGEPIQLDQLRLQTIPFMTQDRYDYLLWSCDINFVRGEDSFVRAQWAAKPFVWHIYPQEEDAHFVKLAAFLRRYRDGMSPALAAATEALWEGWNRGLNCRAAWNLSLEQLSEWQRHSQRWDKTLNSFGGLAAKLVQFCEKPL